MWTFLEALALLGAEAGSAPTPTLRALLRAASGPNWCQPPALGEPASSPTLPAMEQALWIWKGAWTPQPEAPSTPQAKPVTD